MNMWRLVAELGIGGLAGALVGIGAALWIDPTTVSGMGVVVLVFLLVGAICARIISFLLNR